MVAIVEMYRILCEMFFFFFHQSNVKNISDCFQCSESRFCVGCASVVLAV